MARLLVVLLLIPSFLITPPVLAQSSQTLAPGLELAVQPSQASAEALLRLPSVYALPGSFWYWLMHTWEEIQLALTVDPSQRGNLLLKFSQERLAEGYQAIKDGRVQQAVAVLSDYQSKQQQLAASLDTLQSKKIDVTPFLNRLQTQLGVQQALQQYAQTKQLKDNGKIGMLLQVQPIQQLAFEIAHQSMLLGAKNMQASGSAQASATAQASSQANQKGRIQ